MLNLLLKLLCLVDHTIALVLPTDQTHPSGLVQILALIKRSDSVSIRSEGSRVLVNVVKSLWFTERPTGASDERQKKRDQCVASVLTPECANTLTALIGRSNKYPILVNEGIVAISLLSTHKLGGMVHSFQTRLLSKLKISLCRSFGT